MHSMPAEVYWGLVALTALCVHGCTVEQYSVVVDVMPDAYYWETSWFLQIFPGGEYITAGEWSSRSVCLDRSEVGSVSRFVLTVQDLQGDGIGAGGYVKVSIDGVQVAESSGNFGRQQVTSFSIGCTENFRVEID
eukprot:SAG31_NODE_18689_length_626_cov_1.726755_1_plen_134_part_10